MRVLIADLFSLSHIESLKAQGFEILYNDKLNGESLQAALSNFDPHVLVVRSTKVQSNHFLVAKSLEAVIRAGSGYDTIDKSFANSRGVFVANCPGKNAVAVAELTFGLILAIDRRLISNDIDLKQKKWNKGEFSSCKGLKGRTLGIIGYGNIGHEMATRALAFDMNVLVFSRTKPNPQDSRVKVAESLDELLATSDIVTLHLPPTSATKEMVNVDFLKKMKKDAVLINTSRGSLVVEKHLINHLNENPEFYCGTDVFLNEPAEKKGGFTNELGLHPQVIGTHHIGASTKQAEDAIGQEAYRMLIEYQKTGVMPNCVNMGSGLKTNVLTMKYTNTTGFHDELNSLFLKLKIKSLESKTEVFEGGNTGLCVMKMEDTGLKKEVDDGLKAIKDLVNYKWD
jgi:D-3-phosphoglycerate dehydrogenase